MNKFAEDSGFLHSGIHGYRTGMSTTTALIEGHDGLVRVVEEGKNSLLCLLDV